MNQAESRRAMRHLLEYGQTTGSFEHDNEIPEFEDGNLLSFDEPSQILNASWGLLITGDNGGRPSLLNNNNAAQTAASSTSSPTSIADPKDMWYVRRPLSPVTSAFRILNGPPSTPPPSFKTPTLRRPHDPENPDFQADRYYVDVLRKFRCPHFGCR